MKHAFIAALALVATASICEAAPRQAFVAVNCNAPVCDPQPQVAPVGRALTTDRRAAAAERRAETAERRAAARERASRNGFGTPMQPGETQRSWLNGLRGVVPVLASKISSIMSVCPGTQAISTVRHTRIRGTRVVSLHAHGKAVDVTGPYGCIYSQLQGWPGGYSTDSGRVRHIHISLDENGGREMGIRFVHGGGRRHASRWSRASRAAQSRAAYARARR